MTPLTSSTIGTSILVGVDGSPEASDAAVLGRRLARAASGTLHVATAAEQLLAEVAAIRSRLDTERLHRALLDAAREKARAGLAHEVELVELDAALMSA